MAAQLGAIEVQMVIEGLGVVQRARAGREQMRARFRLDEDMGAAGRAEAAMHDVAAVGLARIVGEPPLGSRHRSGRRH